MRATIPFTEQQSEHWLLERTYHVRLCDGRELSVPDFTRAMKQITNFSVPLSTWQEISREEATAAYQDGTPDTIHYTVIASDGPVHEYADQAGAIEGFQVLPLQERSKRSALRTIVFPQFCHYHEVMCPDSVYRLEFFGPRMHEQAYRVSEAAENGRGRTQEA